MTPDVLTTALEAARIGADVLLRWWRRDGLEVDRKAANDYVTRADRESEAAILAHILGRHPGHRVLAEESGATEAAGVDPAEYQWIVDPLDGTTNFLHGHPVFCVSVACRRGRELVCGVVVDPTGGNVFAAERGSGTRWNDRPARVADTASLDGAFLATGYPFRALPALDTYLRVFHEVFQKTGAIRRCGAAALDLAFTATGVYDGFFEFRLSPWDIAAGALLIEEAGGRISDLGGGDSYLRAGNVLAGTPAVHGELVASVRRAGASEADLDRLVPVAWGAAERLA